MKRRRVIKNEYKEDLQELTNIDLLLEYQFACIESERYRKLVRDNPNYKDLQKRLDYENRIKKICGDEVINRMGGNK
jgi:hypothetical protein